MPKKLPPLSLFATLTILSLPASASMPHLIQLEEVEILDGTRHDLTLNATLISPSDLPAVVISATPPAPWIIAEEATNTNRDATHTHHSYTATISTPDLDLRGPRFYSLSLNVLVPQTRHSISFRVSLLYDGKEFRLSSHDELLTAITSEMDGELRLDFDGHIVSPENRDIAPWDDPRLPESHVQILRLKYADKAEPLSARHAALSRQSPNSSELTGCKAGGYNIAGLLLICLPMLMRIRTRQLRPFVPLVLLVLFIDTGVRAEQRCFYGNAAFWDSRSVGGGTHYVPNARNGWQLQPCDTTLTACNPSDSTCCYTGLQQVEVHLDRLVGGVLQTSSVDVDTTGVDGVFLLCDPSWNSTGLTYNVRVRFSRSGVPASMTITNTSSAIYNIAIPAGPLTSAFVNIGLLSANPPGDTSSTAGDLASIWRSATETFQRFEDEGETRHRRSFGSANAFDNIRFQWESGVGAAANCASSTIFVRSGTNPRNWLVAHEIGHVYHCRVVGNGPAFPTNPLGLDGHNRGVGEGISAVEGLADWIGFNWAFNQNSAFVTHILSDFLGCEADTLLNSNHLSSALNNAFGLWQLVDTATDGGDTYADQVNVQIRDVMDALLALSTSGGSSGSNGTQNEQSYTILSTSCASSEDCASGNLCNPGSGQCVSGDVHGANIRDWMRWFPDGNLDKYWQTLVHSSCVGGADNSFPFQPDTLGIGGGYRSD